MSASLSEPAANAANHVAAPDRLTFLVVDDDAELRTYVRRCLRGFGKTDPLVLEAEDGQAALAVLGMQTVDLIISDVVMPRMDGLALCRALGEDEHLRQVPVLLVTGEAPAAARRLAQSAGARGFLAKPFNARKLRAALDALLAR